MIITAIFNRLRAEGIGGSTTIARVVLGTGLALDTLLAWWVLHGIDATALIHAALMVPFGWLGMTWGHGAFQRPHYAVTYQLDNEYAHKGHDATTEKHAFISWLIFGEYSVTDWSTDRKVAYQIVGMAETGCVRMACFALPFLYLSPWLYPVLVLLGALSGPAYWAGWALWVKAVDDIHDMYARRKPIPGFLYNGDHVGDLLQGALWGGIMWLGLALHILT